MANKKVVWGVLVVVLVVGGWYFYQQQNKEFKLITNDDELGQFMINMKEGDLEEYVAKRDELYTQDIYGGETPEETLQMYIEALKAGDLELASKYFRLEDQEKELGELKEITKESLIKTVSVFETMGDASCNERVGWCEIGGVFKGVDVLLARFVKNNQTGKWKMESL